MKWVEANKIEIDFEKEYIAKWKQNYVNNGKFSKAITGTMFYFHSHSYAAVPNYMYEDLYILVPDESPNLQGEERDNFAISFAVWCMYDPQAKLYQGAGITASGLLDKYKSRPYIDTFNTDKN